MFSLIGQNQDLTVNSTSQIVTKQAPNGTFWADLTVGAGFLGQYPTLRRLIQRAVDSIYVGCDPFPGC